MALRLSIIISALTMLLLPTSALASDTIELIVKREPGLTTTEKAAIRADADVRLERPLQVKNYELVTVPITEAKQALAELNSNPDVDFAEKNGYYHAVAVPPFRIGVNDTFFNQQYALHNTGQPINGISGVAGADTNARFAWNLSLGSNVNVAIVDTGVQMDHPDLIGRSGTNSDETPNNGIDDDGNGKIDDVSGWDFVSNDNNPSAIDNGHGTHVAGIVAAARNNSAGIVGVAPSAKYISLRALDQNGSGSWADIIEAFDYAGNEGIPIVNASLGGSGTSSAIDDVIAAHPNTLYVFAAGNGDINNVGLNLDSNNFYPCEAGIGGGDPTANNNTICVASTNSSNAISGFSNYSASGNAVDIAAPGEDIASTFPSSTYTYESGTSMASPAVAGVAALVYSADSSKKGQTLKNLLMNNVRANPALNNKVGSGSVNALAAVKAVVSDSDDDGLSNSSDQCPSQFSTHTSGCPDGDGDNVIDQNDNCPADANSDQADDDGDGQGNVCDATPRGSDVDNDGQPLLDDNCPNNANSSQADDDGDGQGNACDLTPRGSDVDNDGQPLLDDNCPNNANSSQADDDGDGQGNACDLTPRGADNDGDGVGLMDDNCPNNKNADQTDSDKDGIGDVCDSTPKPPDNPLNPDSDGDGFSDNADLCPAVFGKASGCPQPKVTSLKTSKSGKRYAATIIADSSGEAELTLAKKVCRAGKCSFRASGSTRTATLTANQGSKVSLGKLAKGNYRLSAVVINNSVSSAEKVVSFRVK